MRCLDGSTSTSSTSRVGLVLVMVAGTRSTVIDFFEKDDSITWEVAAPM